jgi:hypothetical protein
MNRTQTSPIPTAEETALLITQTMRRSGLKRARISEKTIKLLSKRTHLRSAFLELLKGHLEDIGLLLVEIDTGGYGLIYYSTLNGAQPITAKKYYPKSERRNVNFALLKQEIYENTDDSLDEDE